MSQASASSIQGGSMPKKKKIRLTDIVIYAVIIFLIAKFLGLPQTYLKMDPFGLEAEAVWGGIAAVIGILFNHMLKFEHRLTKVESRLGNIENDLAKIKTKLEVL